MSGAGEGLFAFCALLAVLSALGTVMLHSPIRAAMSLLAHIIALSGLFLVLHAQLLAALQMLVYAGAVVVLFVFVIMLIGPSVPEPPTMRGLATKTGAVAVMIVLTAILAFSLLPVQLPMASLGPCLPGEGAECDQFGGVGAFSQSLFMDGLVPFELISVLLTVAIVGAIAVARGRSPQELAAAQRKRSAAAATPAQPGAREAASAAEVIAAEASARVGHG